VTRSAVTPDQRGPARAVAGRRKRTELIDSPTPRWTSFRTSALIPLTGADATLDRTGLGLIGDFIAFTIESG
jgi:hypothetical protein